MGTYQGTWAISGVVPGAGSQAEGCAGRIAISRQFGPQIQGSLRIIETPDCAPAAADLLTGSHSTDGAVTLGGTADARFTLDRLNCAVTVGTVNLEGRLESDLLTLVHAETQPCDGGSPSVNLELKFTGSR